MAKVMQNERAGEAMQNTAGPMAKRAEFGEHDECRPQAASPSPEPFPSPRCGT